MNHDISEDQRMNYFHICECGTGYHGFIKQEACWSCIQGFLSWFCEREDPSMYDLGDNNDKMEIC